MNAMTVLENALRKGNIIHAFRSGSGLRVVRVEKSEKLTGYGEHPSVDEALRHAAEDFVAGGRPYDKVYGEDALYPNYWTGSSTADSELDAWILQGRTFDVRFESETYVVELKGCGHTHPSDAVNARAKAGETVQWEERGYVYETTQSASWNGQMGISTRVVSSPPERSGSDAWIYSITKIGKASTLVEAFELAHRAVSVEEKAR